MNFALDMTTVRSTLAQKCHHTGLDEPSPQAFLSPDHLAEAGVYWERDLAEQVAASSLPGWTAVTKELGKLLEGFFSE